MFNLSCITPAELGTPTGVCPISTLNDRPLHGAIGVAGFCSNIKVDKLQN